MFDWKISGKRRLVLMGLDASSRSTVCLGRSLRRAEAVFSDRPKLRYSGGSFVSISFGTPWEGTYLASDADLGVNGLFNPV